MRLLRYCLLAACLMAIAVPARAFVPQTIVVDGVNDFDPSNLLDDDRNDTQTFCTPAALPLDLGRVYVTNDNNYLYLGIEFAKTCFCDMNLGFNIDVNTPAGGSADPFGRRIGWANLAKKPDFSVYDVTPTSCNTFNYEILYKWNTGSNAWDNISTQVNPSWGSGSNGLGIVDSLTFKELRIPLSVLGVSAGTVLNLEFWVTQEGTTKGPLDALASDGVQTSTPASTVFDPPATVEMTSQLPYTLLSAIDNVPPTVSSAMAVSFPLLASKQFSTSTNKIDVAFNEPVDLTTAQTAGNYAFSGPSARTVSSAVRDASALNVVHLTLNLPISANASFFNVTVTGVKDIAANLIVANGITNVASFLIQNLVINADMALPLCNGAFAPADTFAVEGSLPPLTFALCDNALLTDANGDSIYTTTVPFCMPKDPVSGKATALLGWKLTAKCSVYESFAGNRDSTLSSDHGATVTWNVAWSNEAPGDFLGHPVDVIFQVDAMRIGPVPADTLYLQGNESPLSFTPSGIVMKDDGVTPDLVAGDKIYTVKARFQKCAGKNLEWKVFYRGAFECQQGQGNRTAWLNDAAFDTVGGPKGALWLPARSIERCSVTDKAVTVVFRVDMSAAGALQALAADTVAVMGDVAPLTFTAPPPALTWMNDSGTGYDTAAGDGLWTAGVTFPDSSNLNLGFKYWKNSVFECSGMSNRSMTIDDVHYSAAVPQVRVKNLWDYCNDVTAVAFEPRTPDATASFAVLKQSFPNPMSPRTTIRFDLKRAGEVTLSVYDVTGRRVTTLLRGTLPAGPHDVQWNGRDESGNLLKSGVYLYELAMGKDRLSRRMVLNR